MEDNKLTNQPDDNPTPNNTPKSDSHTPQPADFSAELKAEDNNLNAEQFAQKQAQYKQILDANNNFEEDNRYIWRIGFGRRTGAYIIDNIFVGLILLIVATITGITDDIIAMASNITELASQPDKINEFNDLITVKMLPLSLAITFIYYSLEVLFAQTLGKMLLGITIGHANKHTASYSKLLLRCAIKNASSIIMLLYLITSLGVIDTLGSIVGFIVWLGCFFVLADSRQALHDKIAGTAVYFKDELQQLTTKYTQNK